MQVQTVFRAGNSDVVSIPKEVMNNRGLKSGIKVIIDEVPELDWVVIRKADSKGATRGEFEKWLEKTLKEDAAILDELELR